MVRGGRRRSRSIDTRGVSACTGIIEHVFDEGDVEMVGSGT
jgi:hypothetical protein